MSEPEAHDFTLVAPPERGLPVLVEVPHAGLRIPPDTQRLLRVSHETLLRDADGHVDSVYIDAPRVGAGLLVAHVSRYVVDLNREPDDVDPASVEGATALRGWFPRGVIWRETAEGHLAMTRKLTRDEYEHRLARYYRPYHEALETTLRGLHRRYGRALVVAAHSMPSHDRAVGTSPGRRRADVVPGTRGRSTADPRLIDLVEQHFRAAGLSVRHDDPYRGGATTQRWGRPFEGFHAIQIELNRGLYMDEQRGTPHPQQVAFLRGLCTRLVARLGEAVEALR